MSLRSIGRFLAACAIYGAVSVALFYRPGLVDGAGYLGNGQDPFLYIWMFKFLPEAVMHLRNPFILPEAWAPYGLNITQATTTPFLALVAWPLTAFVGPVVAFNLLTLAIPALAAAAAFLLVSALTGRWAAAFVGGWIFGFSSAVFGPLQGHLQTDFVVLIPLMFLCLVLRTQGRMSFGLCVAGLSVVGVCQFLTSLETYVTAMIFIMVFAGTAQIVKAGGSRNLIVVSRDNLLLAVGLGFVVTAIIVSPFIFYFFQDYDELPHLLQEGSHYATDLLNFIIPTKITWLGGDAAWAISRRFPGNASEQLGYIGLPLLAISAVAIRKSWPAQLAKPMIVTMIMAVILSLGPELKIAGQGQLPLPWVLMERLPLMGNALPSRLMIFAMLFIAVIIAMWLADFTRFYRSACLLVVAAAAMMLPASKPGGCYQCWYSPLPNDALFHNDLFKTYILQNQIVLFLPFFYYNGNGYAMLWQTESDGYFRMINGYGNFVPPPLSASPAAEFLQPTSAIMPAEPRFITPFVDFMKSNNVRDVIVRDNEVTRWDGFLKSAGWVGQDIDNLRLYRISDAAWQSIAPEDNRDALLNFDAAHLAALWQAAACLHSHGAEKIDDTSAISGQCLDPAYSPQSDDPHENWDCMSGWLGRFDGGIGIGVVVDGREVPYLIRSSAAKITKIYFPYPKVYDRSDTHFRGKGELLLVYSPAAR